MFWAIATIGAALINAAISESEDDAKTENARQLAEQQHLQAMEYEKLREENLLRQTRSENVGKVIDWVGALLQCAMQEGRKDDK